MKAQREFEKRLKVGQIWSHTCLGHAPDGLAGKVIGIRYVGISADNNAHVFRTVKKVMSGGDEVHFPRTMSDALFSKYASIIENVP